MNKSSIIRVFDEFVEMFGNCAEGDIDGDGDIDTRGGRGNGSSNTS